MTQIPETMKAVVFHGPQKIAVEDRPVPKIQDATDAIVKVTLTGLCGRYVLIFSSRSEAYVVLVSSTSSAGTRRVIPGLLWLVVQCSE